MAFARWIRRNSVRQRQARQSRESGFTLLELLIALIVGSIVITGLLALVTEILKIEQRETVIDDTQRDMRRALQFIASDLSEAVYVYQPRVAPQPPDLPEYPAPGWPPSIQGVSALPDGPEIDNIVLAFWRPTFVSEDSLPDPALCAYGTRQSALTPQNRACQDLRQRRAYYSLVIYEIVDNEGDRQNGVWRGEARIVRHVLPKYRNPSTLEDNFGNDGPIDSGQRNWDTWVPTLGNPEITSPVLVDFVADPEVRTANRGDGSCPTSSEQLQLVRSPIDNVASKSFYACIRSQVLVAGQVDNQNIEIFLQGSPNISAGRQQALGASVVNETSLLPILRTTVFSRGIIGDEP